jgi:hypothetical protein
MLAGRCCGRPTLKTDKKEWCALPLTIQEQFGQIDIYCLRSDIARQY